MDLLPEVSFALTIEIIYGCVCDSLNMKFYEISNDYRHVSPVMISCFAIFHNDREQLHRVNNENRISNCFKRKFRKFTRHHNQLISNFGITELMPNGMQMQLILIDFVVNWGRNYKEYFYINSKL